MTYYRAIGFLFPALLLWVFNCTFLFPRIKKLWAETTLPGNDAEWILDLAILLTEEINFVVPAIGLFFLVVEFFWRPWPHFRGFAVATFTIFVNAIVLFGVTAISVTLIAAMPLVKKAPANIAPASQ